MESEEYLIIFKGKEWVGAVSYTHLSDAQSNLKKKIEESFSILTCDVNPINVEKERLEKLFHIFKRSMVGVVLFLLVWEVVCVWVWIADDWPHSLIEYMPFYLPIPLCVGLFWVAIFQMNRAQRQLLFPVSYTHLDGRTEAGQWNIGYR